VQVAPSGANSWDPFESGAVSINEACGAVFFWWPDKDLGKVWIVLVRPQIMEMFFLDGWWNYEPNLFLFSDLGIICPGPASAAPTVAAPAGAAPWEAFGGGAEPKRGGLNTGEAWKQTETYICMIVWQGCTSYLLWKWMKLYGSDWFNMDIQQHSGGYQSANMGIETIDDG
jgi:hypothetical protein